MNNLNIKGAVVRAQDPGFEAAVRGTLFNQRDPGRWPDMMVVPQDVDDVILAIRYAQSAGLRVSVCSGGHSWSANHLRPGSLLINMKGFDAYSVDREQMRATAGPGVGGSTLLTALVKQGLFFPAGHCKGVCIGGYLLQGGFAWNGRKLGMACESVLGLDIVTAKGELLHASPTENADLYWAARGAGGGFFGVVVRYHLRLYQRPKYSAMMTHVFDLKHLESVFNWAYEVGPEIPPAVEFQMLTSRKTLSFCGPGIEAAAPIFADTKEEFEAAQQFMRNSPVKKKAFFRTPALPLPISWMYHFAMTHYPHQYHWGVDNMWTQAPIRDLMPYLKKIAATLPPAPAHMLWLNWHPPVRTSQMAFSVEDKIYIALYGSWKNAADTPKYGNWATDLVKEMAHLGTGIQLADESLHTRPARFMSTDHLQRLDEIRSQRDPQRMFQEWHSRG
jgi:hypothetical protein